MPKKENWLNDEGEAVEFIDPMPVGIPEETVYDEYKELLGVLYRLACEKLAYLSEMDLHARETENSGEFFPDIEPVELTEAEIRDMEERAQQRQEEESTLWQQYKKLATESEEDDPYLEAIHQLLIATTR